MMKNGILTFLFAFCPGAGQMYQGYMKRGLSLITMVCVALIICGAWLVRGPKGRKQKPQNDAEDEDFTEYTAQDAQAEPEARGFAMPKLSALLGKPVTPDDETEDADDGRDEK